MNDFAPWPWFESLGGVRSGSGRSYLIRRILFGVVENRCRDLGMEEGDRIRFMRRGHDEVEVQVPSGDVQTLDLPYAWFVEVEPLRDQSALS